jgi:hypothetical protein
MLVESLAVVRVVAMTDFWDSDKDRLGSRTVANTTTRSPISCSNTIFTIFPSSKFSNIARTKTCYRLALLLVHLPPSTVSILGRRCKKLRRLILTRTRKSTSYVSFVMAIMLSLPTETLVKVFESVEPKDLKSLRITCKRFEGAATPLFAEQYFVDRRRVMTMESIKALEDIVLHQYFGNFVQSIAFNCVRTIPPDALNEEDIRDPVPPLQVNPEEGRDQSYAKLTELCNVVKRIHPNHGKIGLGVFFENFHDEQPCHGLVDGLRYCTIDWSTGYRPSYSMMHLRNTLRALLRTCEVLHCPVQRIEVDLGRHSALFRRMVRYWHPDFERTTTLCKDIEEMLPSHTTSDLSLVIKKGGQDSRSSTFTYDHVNKSIKVHNAPSVVFSLKHPVDLSGSGWSCFPPMRYLTMPPGDNEWFNGSQIETLDITSSGSPSFINHFLGHRYLAPCRQHLKHLKLQRTNVPSLGVWSRAAALISYFPVLETCKLFNLASVELPADRSQEARFLEIVRFEAEGCELKNRLRDLSARLQAFEAAWRSEPVDSPSKWLDNLGAKVDDRIQEIEESTSNAEANPAVQTDPLSSPTGPEPTSVTQVKTLSDGTERAPDSSGVPVGASSTASEQVSELPESSLEPSNIALSVIHQHNVVEVTESGDTLRKMTAPIESEPSDDPGAEKALLTNTTMYTTGSSNFALANGSTSVMRSLRPEGHDASFRSKELLLGSETSSVSSASSVNSTSSISSTRAGGDRNPVSGDEEDSQNLSVAMAALSIQAMPCYPLGKNKQEDASKWAQGVEFDFDRITIKHHSNHNASGESLEELLNKTNGSETGNWAAEVNSHLEKVFQKHQSSD